MTNICAMPKGSCDAYEQLVEGLRSEFGCNDVGAIAARIVESEQAEFHWEARVRERYLGQHFPYECSDEEGAEDFSQMAILSFLAGRWHAGVCVVDGEGCASELLWLLSFERRRDAADAFVRAR
ncbi:MAG TPA: hypothetical protein VFK19_10790 [Sphingomicrobium sp.]|nr:hypothetical protein [Sphingomicrobium sp.]